MTPVFTKDWFDRAIPIWKKYVMPLINTVPNARWLEIGSFEGRSAIWTLENLGWSGVAAQWEQLFKSRLGS